MDSEGLDRARYTLFKISQEREDEELPVVERKDAKKYTRGSEFIRNSFDGKSSNRIDRLESSNRFTVHAPQQTLSPKDAMRFLFSYVRLDYDGGIENLGGQEHSKLHIFFRRDAFRNCMAFLVLLRMATNVSYVLYSSTLLVYFDLVHGNLMSFAQQMGAAGLPVRSMAVAVAVFELLRGIFIIACILRDSLQFCRSSDSDLPEGVAPAKAKYYALANFFLVHSPALTNFSALQCLGYVHPAFLKHSADKMIATDIVARTWFERLFGIDHQQMLSDDELHDHVIHLIRRARDEHTGSTDDESELHYYTTLTSYALFQELLSLENLSTVLTTEFDNKIKDPEAIRQAYKVRFASYFETFVFVVGVIMFALFGAAAFVVKLARIHVHILDKQVNRSWLYFSMASFLNQAMGMVSIHELLRERIFRFIFGGEKAKLSSEEENLMNTYQALLVERIWTARPDEIGIWRRCMVLLTFSDNDIQRLVLEESERRKAAIVRGMWDSRQDNQDSLPMAHILMKPLLESIRSTQAPEQRRESHISNHSKDSRTSSRSSRVVI